MSEEKKLEHAIRALEAQREALGDSVVETATGELREKLAALSVLSSKERRQLVTVLFADVSGFTALSERLDPEEVQSLLAALWRRLDRVIVGLRGRIDKHIGDAVMAVWGLSDARESDASDAVRAGLAMQRELEAFRSEARVELAMRVGINTGLASISTVESTGEQNVIGDSVNLASRMEHAAEVGTVLLGETTAEHARHRFDLEALPPLRVKGKAEPVQCYRVAREKPRQARTHASTLSGIAARTIGRETELGTLLQQFQIARDGKLRFVTVVGDAGIGKTRVLSEAVGLLRRQGDAAVIVRAQAWPETERAPFYLLREICRARAGIAEHAEARAAQEQLCLLFLPTLGEALASEAAAFVGQLLGWEDTQNTHVRHILRDPAQIRGRAEVLLRTDLERAANRQLLVFVLEDLHWADRESVEFLSELVALAPPWRVLVLASARPALFSRPGGFPLGKTRSRPDAHVSLLLSPLAEEETAALAASLVSRVASQPPWLLDLITRRGGGNPFFCEEVVRWLIARGVIDTETEPWSVRADATPGSVMPARVELVLHERLEQLGADARKLLSAASVVGTSVSREAMAAVLGEPLFEPALAELEATGILIRARPLDGQSYEFSHALLREVTYEYTLKRERKSYHQHAAEWLAESGSVPANVAWHFEQAGDRAHAARWYLIAGQQARDGNAPDAAIASFEKVLVLGDDRAQALGAHEGSGDAFQHKARYGDAVDAYRAMLEAATLLGDAGAQARALNGMSWAQSQQGEHRAAIDSALRAEAIARSAMEAPAPASPLARPPAVELANALHNRGWNHVLLSEADPAIALGERAYETARVVGAQREMALALNLIGVAKYYLLEDYDGGARYQEQALAIYRAIGDRWGVACQLNNLGETARMRGEFHSAVALFHEALAITREIAHRTQERISLANLGAAEVEAGEHASGEATLREVLSRQAGEMPFYASETQRYLAEACLAQRRLDTAMQAGLCALELAIGSGNVAYRGAAWRVLGQLLAAGAERAAIDTLAGPSCDAEQCFAQSVQALRSVHNGRELRATYRAWARFEAERGDPARAGELESLADGVTSKERTGVRNTLF
jgi:class 3 adenylate cyclase/tetratricopeptide (TPR) repeat protein